MTAYLRRHHVALLALFVALGGTSYAAVKLPRNSVTSLTVKDRSLLAKDFRSGQLPRGAAGAAGLPGAAGLQGAKGDAGPAGAQGETGTPGAKGDVGPTYARSSLGFGGDTPGPSPVTTGTLEVDLPTAGRLYLSAQTNVSATCGVSACTLQVGLYVDGVPVGGSGGPTASGAAGESVGEFVTLAGLTDVLTAGPHTVAIGRRTSGPTEGFSTSRRVVRAVLVGPS